MRLSPIWGGGRRGPPPQIAEPLPARAQLVPILAHKCHNPSRNAQVLCIFFVLRPTPRSATQCHVIFAILQETHAAPTRSARGTVFQGELTQGEKSACGPDLLQAISPSSENADFSELHDFPKFRKFDSQNPGFGTSKFRKHPQKIVLGVESEPFGGESEGLWNYVRIDLIF